MKKSLIKKIAAAVGSILLIAFIIVGDCLCYAHENEITSHLCPKTIIYDTTKTTETLAESDNVIQRVAEEGITLLKNNGALPLDFSELDDDETYNVNLFGVGSTDLTTNGFYLFGAGSGSVTLYFEDAVFLKQGLENTGYSVNANLYNYFKTNKKNPNVEWWNSSQAKSECLDYAKQFSDTAIVTISRFTGENAGDLQNAGDICSWSFSTPWPTTYEDKDSDGRNFCQLSLKEEAMIKYCAENFEKVIVLINSGNVMELGLLEELDGVDAVIYVPYPGQSGANAIGKILKGEVTPSGKTTDTFAYSMTENAPYYADAFYIGYKTSKQLAYTEDIYIGYKWYETADKEGYFTAKGTSYDKVVLYPFGYGLTYTSFEWTVKDVSIKKTGEEAFSTLIKGDTITDKNATVRVAVEVKNTGSVAGKEVVQLYTTAPYTKGGIEKPYVALTDFAKTKTLYPASEADGKDKLNSETVTLEFNLYDIASYDSYDKNGNGFKGYELDGGDYTLSLRNNAHEVNACENANFNFKIGASGLRYETDPVTGYTVENRFTGETAEAGVPIDGNDNGKEITYLSRENFANTFPTEAFAPRTSGYDITRDKGIGAYMDDSDYYDELEMPEFDNTDSELYLYTLENGERASKDDLDGKGKKIIVNEKLAMELGENYDSPKWEQLLSQISVLEVKDIVTRCSLGTLSAYSIGKAWDFVTDGPQGANMSTSGEKVENVSAFPCEAMMGMTWNKDLLREVGAAMAKETTEKGMIGLYAPAVDTHRHPFNGRNYEQFGEDGVLVGKLGAKEVYGMITHGVQPSVKHFVISTPGFNPRYYNSWITEQNLRENYLKAFEWTVKEGKTNFLMTSFNNIGGVMCATSYALNTEILRNEWGFKGSVITDYNVTTTDGKTTANLIRAGNDLRFQGSIANRSELDETNAVDMALAVRSVKNSLYSFCNTYYRTKTYDPNYSMTSYKVVLGFNWWIPSLVALNVLIFAAVGIMIFFNFLSKKGRSETVELVSAIFGKKPAQTATASNSVVATEDTALKSVEQVTVEPVKAKEDRKIPLTPMSAPQKPLDTSSKEFASELDKNYFNGVKYQALSVIQGSAATEENGEVTIAVNGDKKLQIAVEDGKTAVYFYQGSCAIAKIKIVSLKTYRAAMLLIG